MEKVKKYIRNNKIRVFSLLILFVTFIAIFIWTNNNYSVYKYIVMLWVSFLRDFMKRTWAEISLDNIEHNFKVIKNSVNN